MASALSPQPGPYRVSLPIYPYRLVSLRKSTCRLVVEAVEEEGRHWVSEGMS